MALEMSPKPSVKHKYPSNKNLLRSVITPEQDTVSKISKKIFMVFKSPFHTVEVNVFNMGFMVCLLKGKWWAKFEIRQKRIKDSFS